jgi:hypothetical protein
MKRPVWYLKLKEYVLPARRIAIVEADTPPDSLPSRNLILAREDNEDWAVAFRCPCGCGKRLELLLVDEAKPNWKLTLKNGEKPTLHPSVWLKNGCRSHFWLRDGKIVWC